MTSTSKRICTGFVPGSIISGIAAGQGSGERYRSLLLMKRTTQVSDQRIRRDIRRHQGIYHGGLRGATGARGARPVPDLYRIRARNLADRRSGVTR